ncbi:MAG: tetratricopeptide repeat protein [Pseudomonadota bacterium]|nr:tetratricopeptide repeat protein [Pseudomonadota bacterium]
MDLTIENALKRGIEAHKAGQITEADRFYTAILRAQPKHPDANHNMGVLAVSIGKIEEALPFFRTALEANPAVNQFWASLIDALIKLGRVNEAENLFFDAKEKGASGVVLETFEMHLYQNRSHNNDSGASRIKGRTYPETNILDTVKIDKAVKIAKKLIKVGQIEEGKRIFQTILNKFPTNKIALKALRSLEQDTTSKLPDPPSSQLEALLNYYGKGQLQKTLGEATNMLSDFPNSPTLYSLCGASHAGMKQFDQAIVHYKKALKVKPDFFEAYINMGNAHKAKGDIEKAIDNYRSALKINPNIAEAYINMGNAQKDRGEVNAAIESFTQALTIKPNYIDIYINIGNALQASGDTEAAINNYKKALRIKPDFAEAHYNIGNILYQQGHPEKAIKNYKKALKIKPGFAAACYNIANILKEQNELRTAIKWYRETLHINPNYSEAKLNLGNTLRAIGDMKEAINIYDKLEDPQSVAKALECTYFLSEIEEFNRRLEAISKTNPRNIGVAAISAFAAHQLQQQDTYPFCKNAIDLIKYGTVKSHVKDVDRFIDKILREMSLETAVWEPKSKTTKGGFQTSNKLFSKPSPTMKKLEEIIKTELHLFYEKFSDHNSTLIQDWPKDLKISAWYVRILQNGHQGSHIHPSGWVSGVLYLKTVDAPRKNEGAIEFGLHGYEYPITNENYPRQLYQPSKGDLVLFPSSLFHKTIPVIQNVERCVIAFDLVG